jgi:transcription termination factor Rho
MEGHRFALLIATDRYQDTGLAKLAAPASDAEKLAAVLQNPEISGFQVTSLHNEPLHVAGRAIGEFYRNRNHGDLTFLYFTGHGVKDDYGHLYLAMTDTSRDNLEFTGMRGDQVRAGMDSARSRQNVLVLDCCYAGAFPAGHGLKGSTEVHALEHFGGKGSVVLTSSDATQYSFEGNRLTETGSMLEEEESISLFTRFLIEGIETGNADLDGDGDIALDELYSYVYDRVIGERPQQRPKKKEDIEGRIIIAQNTNWTLPPHISAGIDSPYAEAKLTVLDELRRRYAAGNQIVRARITESVHDLAADDSRKVSEAAQTFLSELRPPHGQRDAINLSAQARQIEASSGDVTSALAATSMEQAQPGLTLAGEDEDSHQDDVFIPIAGILTLRDDSTWVQTTGYLPGAHDVSVSVSHVREHGLRWGDVIEGAVREPREGERREPFSTLARLDKVTGLKPEESSSRPDFAKLISIYPRERLRLETDPAFLTTRIVDLVAPIGKGQRGVIFAPPESGRATILQSIGKAINKNNPECHLMVILVDQPREDITEMQRSFKAEVIFSTFDHPPEDHVFLAETAIERAKRLVELGHDVVVFLDSITQLKRAYQAVGSREGGAQSEDVRLSAITETEQFFGAAGKIENGGSLTIIGVLLTDTGLPFDYDTFERFKTLGNMGLWLRRDLADEEIFPPVDVHTSNTRKAEYLMTVKELEGVRRLRRALQALEPREALLLLIDQVGNTRSNSAFLLRQQKTAHDQSSPS